MSVTRSEDPSRPKRKYRVERDIIRYSLITIKPRIGKHIQRYNGISKVDRFFAPVPLKKRHKLSANISQEASNFQNTLRSQQGIIPRQGFKRKISRPINVRRDTSVKSRVPRIFSFLSQSAPVSRVPVPLKTGHLDIPKNLTRRRKLLTRFPNLHRYDSKPLEGRVRPTNGKVSGNATTKAHAIEGLDETEIAQSRRVILGKVFAPRNPTGSHTISNSVHPPLIHKAAPSVSRSGFGSVLDLDHIARRPPRGVSGVDTRSVPLFPGMSSFD